METHINSWGNSLAVRIPKSLAKELGFKENSPVDIGVEGGALFVKPMKKKSAKNKVTLKDLLAKMPKDYDPLADEELVAWRNELPVGKEVW